MASLVGRVLDREAIENRKCYLQLFFCQRAARFAKWWSADLKTGDREAFLEECGVPRAATPAAARKAAFPPGFHVEGLLERVPIEDATGEPQLFAPRVRAAFLFFFDGTARGSVNKGTTSRCGRSRSSRTR